ncbi:hypothetical protein CHARACLAT_020118 [Characodon lateralis]|uniref:Uncharacterized protein n=1 Tax=Characodon lateralis TaxID=208331 RepID=A0ABU7EW87_9TELE|nr:hypothetical protein [Characodon lateralis]
MSRPPASRLDVIFRHQESVVTAVSAHIAGISGKRNTLEHTAKMIPNCRFRHTIYTCASKSLYINKALSILIEMYQNRFSATFAPGLHLFFCCGMDSRALQTRNKLTERRSKETYWQSAGGPNEADCKLTVAGCGNKNIAGTKQEYINIS